MIYLVNSTMSKSYCGPIWARPHCRPYIDNALPNGLSGITNLRHKAVVVRIFRRIYNSGLLPGIPASRGDNHMGTRHATTSSFIELFLRANIIRLNRCLATPRLDSTPDDKQVYSLGLEGALH